MARYSLIPIDRKGLNHTQLDQPKLSSPANVSRMTKIQPEALLNFSIFKFIKFCDFYFILFFLNIFFSVMYFILYDNFVLHDIWIERQVETIYFKMYDKLETSKSNVILETLGLPVICRVRYDTARSMSSSFKENAVTARSKTRVSENIICSFLFSLSWNEISPSRRSYRVMSRFAIITAWRPYEGYVQYSLGCLLILGYKNYFLILNSRFLFFSRESWIVALTRELVWLSPGDVIDSITSREQRSRQGNLLKK
ncbi:hypothetical protein PUN28_013586 [Cardiocondyla obscurior]|uniref:Uncharacterized protein n=1 Tax=Cardiocondyla obscurior TaxID=286306 RepID=A0AAW2F216_9HYME